MVEEILFKTRLFKECKQMRGVGVFEFGGPEVLQVTDLPEVHAGPGEVRVRVHAAAVSPTDTDCGAELERKNFVRILPHMYLVWMLPG